MRYFGLYITVCSPFSGPSWHLSRQPPSLPASQFTVCTSQLTRSRLRSWQKIIAAKFVKFCLPCMIWLGAANQECFVCFFCCVLSGHHSLFPFHVLFQQPVWHSSTGLGHVNNFQPHFQIIFLSSGGVFRVFIAVFVLGGGGVPVGVALAWYEHIMIGVERPFAALRRGNIFTI